MKYPTILMPVTLRIAGNRIVGSASGAAQSGIDASWLDDLHHDLGNAVKWWGEGEELDLAIFNVARLDIETLIVAGQKDGLDLDQVEGKAACRLFRAVNEAGVEAPVLDDPGFWRYLALACVWNLIVWRHREAFRPVGAENGVSEPKRSFRKYVDGLNSRECVPARMYLRIKSLGGLEHAELAWAVQRSVDFWRSHILRVRVGEYPPLVRAVVRRQANSSTRLSVNPVRAFAKELTRTLTNLVPGLLDDEAAEELVGELWQRQLTQVVSDSDDGRSPTANSL